MESKRFQRDRCVRCTFNRTSMESKPGHERGNRTGNRSLLIEPVWNRNKLTCVRFMNVPAFNRTSMESKRFSQTASKIFRATFNRTSMESKQYYR